MKWDEIVGLHLFPSLHLDYPLLKFCKTVRKWANLKWRSIESIWNHYVHPPKAKRPDTPTYLSVISVKVHIDLMPHTVRTEELLFRDFFLIRL